MPETISWKAFMIAPMIGGGSCPSALAAGPEISVMDIDTPGGRPVTFRVRWLCF